MANGVFHQIYLHIVWHTNDSAPTLIPRIESRVHEEIREKCRLTKGVVFYDVNGKETHVHLVVGLEPSVKISDFVGQVKGASSHETNSSLLEKVVDWQRGYGVVSFSKRDLPFVLKYVANQKMHHADNTWNATLEHFTDDDA